MTITYKTRPRHNCVNKIFDDKGNSKVVSNKPTHTYRLCVHAEEGGLEWRQPIDNEATHAVGELKTRGLLDRLLGYHNSK